MVISQSFRSLLSCLFLLTIFIGGSPVFADNTESTFGFVENRGQMTDDLGDPVPNVFFQSRFAGMGLFVTTDGLTCVFHQREHKEKKRNSLRAPFNAPKEGRRAMWRMDIRLVDGRISPEALKGETIIPGHQNFFITNATEGIYGVRSFEQVRISEVYPGIDWVLGQDEKGRFKHEFEIAPGADPNLIQLEYLGAQIERDPTGKTLRVQTPLGSLEEGDLRCFLSPSGTEVEGQFRINGNLVSYDLGPHPKNESLIIDPSFELVWATRYGGGEYEGPHTMAIQDKEGLYIAGYSFSLNFPIFNPGGGTYYDPTITAGLENAYITKFSQNGVREWATHYNRARFLKAILDNNGNLYLTGAAWQGFSTQDPGGGAFFQGTPNLGMGPAGSDACIVKFDVNGVRQWATFLGGSGSEQAYSLALDGLGGFYIAGNGNSADYPLLNPGGGAYFNGTLAGASDIFISRFDASGALTWSTYYGGADHDFTIDIKLNSQNQLFLGGMTRSTNFPTLDPGGGAYFQGISPTGDENVILMEFTPANQLLYSTYIGGNDWEELNGMDFDPHDNLYLAGTTKSPDFPTLDPGGGAFFQGTWAGGDWDAYYLKFNANRQLKWGTFFGGSGSEWPGPNYDERRIEVDETGTIYFHGRTRSPDLPVLAPGNCGASWFQDTLSSCGDNIFLGAFDSTGVLLWSTHHGCHTTPSDIALDGQGNIYIAGEYWYWIGEGPYVDPGGGAWFQTTSLGSDDMMLLKFQVCSLTSETNFTDLQEASPWVSSLVPNPASDRVMFHTIPDRGSIGATLQLEVTNTLGKVVRRIDYGEVDPLELQEFSVAGLATGMYLVSFLIGEHKEVQRLQVVR